VQAVFALRNRAGAAGIGFTAEVCWPYALVGWVKGSFFKQRRFRDRQDLVDQLLQWRIEMNTERPSRATNVIPALRREQELPLPDWERHISGLAT
jgi:hypothetical protein